MPAGTAPKRSRQKDEGPEESRPAATYSPWQKKIRSHIDPFHSSPAEVPAWTVAEMGKQGVNALLVFRPQKHKLSLAALQADRIIALDFHHAKLITALRDPIPKGEIVTNVQNEQRQNRDEE